MPTALARFQDDMKYNSVFAERCLSHGFNVADLIQAANDSGYHFEKADLQELEDEIKKNDIINLAMYLPSAKTGEIVELNLDDLSLVAGGLRVPDSVVNVGVMVNVGFNVTVAASGAVAAVAVLAVAAAVVVVGLVFVLDSDPGDPGSSFAQP